MPIENEADIIEIKSAYKRKCNHGPYVIDMALDTVECDKCKDHLNPMWVLKDLMELKSRYNNEIWKKREELKRLNEDLEKAKNKARCKCQHCHKMTRIIRFKPV